MPSFHLKSACMLIQLFTALHVDTSSSSRLHVDDSCRHLLTASELDAPKSKLYMSLKVFSFQVKLASESLITIAFC